LRNDTIHDAALRPPADSVSGDSKTK
jgi:hypothetical protein